MFDTMGSRSRRKQRSFNAFHVGDDYLFKHHFEPDLFEVLRQYYNDEEYRFEVPHDRMPSIERLLLANFYDVTVIENTDRFCVVLGKGQHQPDWLFEKVVLRESTLYHHIYLLEDQVAVEEAVYHGFSRLDQSDVDSPF